jgi:HD-like signal output (HDOD) protein
MAKSPQDLLRGYFEIASLPVIYTRINDVTNDPRKSMADISKVISEDSGLSARLLRIVNSAFYNFPSRVETISRAVTIVGTQQLRALALATSVLNLFKGVPATLVNMESFWKHSITCGLAARAIAAYRREPNTEFFFTAGVMHDIGRLIMFTRIPEESKAAMVLAKEKSELLYIAEREVIGFDHAAVGRALVQLWKLPSSLEEVVAFHNHPSGATRYPVETGVIHLADIIAHTMRAGTSGESFVPPLYRNSWETIGLNPSILTTTVDQVELQSVEMMRTLMADRVS